MSISKVSDIRRAVHLEQFMVARYGGFYENVVLPHDVWVLLAREAPPAARLTGNPPRVRLYLGEARYEVIAECAPEKNNRAIKGSVDLTKDA